MSFSFPGPFLPSTMQPKIVSSQWTNWRSREQGELTAIQRKNT